MCVYLCVCTCTYARVRVSTDLRVFTKLYVNVLIYMCIYTCAFLFMHVYVYLCLCTCMLVRLCMHVYVLTCICTCMRNFRHQQLLYSASATIKHRIQYKTMIGSTAMEALAAPYIAPLHEHVLYLHRRTYHPISYRQTCCTRIEKHALPSVNVSLSSLSSS